MKRGVVTLGIGILLATVLAVLGIADARAHCYDRVFSTIDTRQGLSDNQVLHILQVPDGRMVITTAGNINIYDGRNFTHVHYSPDTNFPIPAYEGYQHVYISRDGHIWNKSQGNVQCFDLNTHRYVTAPGNLLERLGADKSPLDLFVDREGELWTVTKDGLLDTHRKRLIPLRNASLQDVEIMGDTAMLFYSTGLMEGYDRNTGGRLWESRAYGDSTLYPATSLVRTAPDGTVWQVRSSAANGAVLLRFDPSALEWKEILKTPYMLHTLDVTSHGEVYVASAEGLWYTHLEEQKPRKTVKLSGVKEVIDVGEGFNTLFVDRDGGHWIGTYGDGVLYSPATGIRLISRKYLSELAVDSAKMTPPAYGPDRALRDKKGVIWIPTKDGLRRYDPATYTDTIFYVEDGLSNNFIKSLALSPDGAVWAATANGINMVSTDSLGRVSTKAFGTEEGVLAGEYAEEDAWLTEDGWPVFRHPAGWTLVSPTGRLTPPVVSGGPDSASKSERFLGIIIWMLAIGLFVIACLWLYIRHRHRGRRHESSVGPVVVKAVIEQSDGVVPAADSQAISRVSELAADNSHATVFNDDDTSDDSAARLCEEDREFIERATELVDANLTTGYTVERLSSDLCMERTGLYKRINAILGKSPSAFIRGIRLRHVAHMVVEGKLSINEIAEQTGFSSSSHMSRCFKEEYGCTPSDYPTKRNGTIT